MMSREASLQELKDLYDGIRGPFPYADVRKMYANEELASHFKELGEDDWLTADMNTYVMGIIGIVSRILQGKKEGMPENFIAWLALGDFFTIFPKYRFLEDKWEYYTYFAHMYTSAKRMQEIVLTLLLTDDELLALQKQNPCQGWESFLGPVTYINNEEDKKIFPSA
jgi:hypothetical protein